jgi:hypothetical protein
VPRLADYAPVGDGRWEVERMSMPERLADSRRATLPPMRHLAALGPQSRVQRSAKRFFADSNYGRVILSTPPGPAVTVHLCSSLFSAAKHKAKHGSCECKLPLRTHAKVAIKCCRCSPINQCCINKRHLQAHRRGVVSSPPYVSRGWCGRVQAAPSSVACAM